MLRVRLWNLRLLLGPLGKSPGEEKEWERGQVEGSSFSFFSFVLSRVWGVCCYLEEGKQEKERISFEELFYSPRTWIFEDVCKSEVELLGRECT